jgi:hypothetical protein
VPNYGSLLPTRAAVAESGSKTTLKKSHTRTSGLSQSSRIRRGATVATCLHMLRAARSNMEVPHETHMDRRNFRHRTWMHRFVGSPDPRLSVQFAAKWQWIEPNDNGDRVSAAWRHAADGNRHRWNSRCHRQRVSGRSPMDVG